MLHVFQSGNEVEFVECILDYKQIVSHNTIYTHTKKPSSINIHPVLQFTWLVYLLFYPIMVASMKK